VCGIAGLVDLTESPRVERATLREMARACASTSVAMAVTNMVADAIELFGTDDQKERLLVPLMRGDLECAAFCLSEPEVGSDATALRTTARRDGDHYLLEGTKQWFDKILIIFNGRL